MKAQALTRQIVARCVPQKFVTTLRSARELGAGYANPSSLRAPADITNALSATIAPLVQDVLLRVALALFLPAGATISSVPSLWYSVRVRRQ